MHNTLETTKATWSRDMPNPTKRDSLDRNNNTMIGQAQQEKRRQYTTVKTRKTKKAEQIESW